MPPLEQKRSWASSVLDKDGNMWVIGGKNGKSSVIQTAKYHYRWQNGKPLPQELTLSGIEGHCTVRINDTHIFMAGGFARPYIFTDPFQDDYQDYQKS